MRLTAWTERVTPCTGQPRGSPGSTDGSSQRNVVVSSCTHDSPVVSTTSSRHAVTSTRSWTSVYVASPPVCVCASLSHCVSVGRYTPSERTPLNTMPRYGATR